MRPSLSWTLASETSAAATARSLLRSELSSQPADLIEDAELVVSELVSNAVRHGSGPITLTLEESDSGVRLCVSSASATDPTLTDAGAQSPGGRGLAIIAALAADWGWERDGPLVTVWALLATPDPTPPN